MKGKSLFVAASLLSMLLAFPAESMEQDGEDITVHVAKNGNTIIVDVDFSVPASQREAWNVLTDFDHMHEFVSNLQSSKVITQNAHHIQVAQVGKASKGMLAFSFDSVRDVELFPYHTIQSRLVKGNMKRLDGHTSLRREGGATRIAYHGESVPNMWVPPFVGERFIAHEVEEQFREMRVEILRRRKAADPGRQS
jgi:ribosome-associated toxin RatA of RatAB toxin-antitoxin module